MYRTVGTIQAPRCPSAVRAVSGPTLTPGARPGRFPRDGRMRVLQLCPKVPWPPEDGGRIAVKTQSALFNQDLTPDLHLKLQGVVDASAWSSQRTLAGSLASRGNQPPRRW